MSFTMYPSTPTAVPSQAQLDAFNYLQSGQTAFANPNASHMTDIASANSNVGGLDMQAFGDTLSTGVKNGSITQADADSMYSQLSPIGLDSHAGINSSLAGTHSQVSAQTTQVVNNMPRVLSASSSYATTSQNYGKSSLCEGIESVLGSLGGAADDLFAGIKSAYNAINTALSTVAGWIKTAFNAAVDALGAAMADGEASSKSAMDSLSSAIGSLVSGADSSIMNTIKSALSAIKSGLDTVNGMIAKELTALGHMFDYLQNAATAALLGALHPCSQQVVRNTAGAAGAGPIIGLVS